MSTAGRREDEDPDATPGAEVMGPGLRRDDWFPLFPCSAAPPQIWIGLPVTAIAASFTASEWVGWAWQV
jgi:hypothetical protein